MINDIGQFRFGESDATKKRLSAVSNTNKFRQETGNVHVIRNYEWPIVFIFDLVLLMTCS